MLPRAPWADALVREVLDFGPGARRDDQVDALVSAHAALAWHMLDGPISITPAGLRWDTDHGLRGLMPPSFEADDDPELRLPDHVGSRGRRLL